MKTNYHTHTTRCHHAEDSDEKYIISAIKGGYTTLGFSDHTPWKYASNFKGRIRMDLSEFDEYQENLLSLRQKYKNEIDIKIGLECEYFPAYMEWLAHFKKEKNIDYLILGNHFYQSDETGVYYGYGCDNDAVFIQYIDGCIEGLKTGMFAYLAHPDLFMRGRPHFDALAQEQSERLCRACKDMGVVLEYNLEGMRLSQARGHVEYPHPDFWAIASRTGNTAIIGVDAHKAMRLEDTQRDTEARQILRGLDITIVEDIEECEQLQKNAKTVDFKAI